MSVRQVKKVAIVGGAPSSRLLAPFADESWNIWSFSASNHDKLPRINQWFELHSLADLTSERWAFWAKDYLAWLASAQFIVWMQERNTHVPGALQFPKDAIVSTFGGTFFTSTVAWMMAMAIKLEVEEIGLYGVDMTAGSEYEYERPGCQYFISLARSKGIKVTLPPQSDLDHRIPLYGFDDASPIAIKLKTHSYELRDRIAELDRNIANLDAQRAKMMLDRAHLQGAHEQAIYMRRTFVAWSGPDS